MRQVTATEKYRAVNEGKMAKGEFVRQMRMAYPSVISQWNSYNDTVTILKNRGYITEKTGVDTYDSRYDLNISSESIDRGVRYELAAQGHDPATVTDKELVAKVTDRVVKNLKKDPLHYINLLAKESSHVDKNDKMKETKRGAQETDTFNGMKKADLKENTDINSAKDNIIKVASVIRAKYAEIPGFNSILKDFLQTHQHDIKAGKVTDPIADFDNYIDANYDRLDEQPVEEGIGTIALGVAGGLLLLKVLKFVLKKVVGSIGMNVKLPKEKLLEIVEQTVAATLTKASSSGFNIMDIMALQIYLKDEINSGRITTIKQIVQVVEKVSKKDKNESENENYGPDIAEKKGKDHDKDGDIDGDDYMIAKDKAIKKAMGKDEAVREHVKNIITKVLEEQMINEAATNELARLADDYAEFQGMKQSIIALQDIVTDIESFYDKTREKIQKVYDSIGEIRNEEGLKVGGFIAPTIEAAFNKDLRPVTKVGFTGGLETPKVKTISKAEVDAARERGEIEEEPKQTLFTPISESKKKK